MGMFNSFNYISGKSLKWFVFAHEKRQKWIPLCKGEKSISHLMSYCFLASCSFCTEMVDGETRHSGGPPAVWQHGGRKRGQRVTKGWQIESLSRLVQFAFFNYCLQFLLLWPQGTHRGSWRGYIFIWSAFKQKMHPTLSIAGTSSYSMPRSYLDSS